MLPECIPKRVAEVSDIEKNEQGAGVPQAGNRPFFCAIGGCRLLFSRCDCQVFWFVTDAGPYALHQGKLVTGPLLGVEMFDWASLPKSSTRGFRAIFA